MQNRLSQEHCLLCTNSFFIGKSQLNGVQSPFFKDIKQAWYVSLYLVCQPPKENTLTVFVLLLQATGDTENAAWCIYCYAEIIFHTGSTSLEQITQNCGQFVQQLHEVGQEKIETFLRILWQLLLNLTGESGETIMLDGEAFNNVESQAEITRKKDEHLQAQLDRFRLMAAFWFADYRMCLHIANEKKFDKDAYAKNSPCVFGIGPLAFHIALSALIIAGESSGVDAKRYKAIGTSHFAKIRTWVNKGNPNVMHFEALLDAEMAVISNDPFRARRNFEIAILMCESRNLTNYQALAHERFAYFLEREDDSLLARSNMKKAIGLFDDWGANARANQLRGVYGSSSSRVDMGLLIPEASDFGPERERIVS